MTEFRDPKSNKLYTIRSLAAMSASAAAGTADGRSNFERVDLSRVPVRAKSRDQAKFVDLTKCETGSIFRDKTNGTVIVGFKKSAYKEMLIGEGSFISQSFGSQAYLQVSASIANSFLAGLNEDFVMGYAFEEFYSASDAALVGNPTASFRTLSPEGSASFSGIANTDPGGGLPSFYTLTFDFSGSRFVANTSITAQGGDDLLHSVFVESFDHKFLHDATNSGSIALTTSSLTHTGTIGNPINTFNATPASGAFCLSSVTKNILSGSDTLGSYRAFFLKGRVAGDADSGSLYDFLPTNEIIIYSSSVTVASGSYFYLPNTASFVASQTESLRALVTSSTEIVELFYISGANNGPSGSQTGSGVFLESQPLQPGSLVHGDPLLRTTASYGFYSPTGSLGVSSEVFEISTSSLDNESFNFDSSNFVMKVPRFLNKVT